MNINQKSFIYKKSLTNIFSKKEKRTQLVINVIPLTFEKLKYQWRLGKKMTVLVHAILFGRQKLMKF